MQKYLELISTLVQKEEPLLLPDIGVFTYKSEPAKEDPENNRLLPPYTHIVLEKAENISSSYHSIVREIKTRFHLSKEEARAEWNKTVGAIKERLNNGEIIAIPGIGKLKYNAQQQFEFVELPADTSIYSAVPFNLQSQEETATNPDEPLPYESEPRRKNTVWLIIAAIVVLLVIGYFMYSYLFYPPSKQLQKDPAITPTERTGPPLSSTPSTDSVQPRQAASGNYPVSDSIHFAVIYAVYHSKENAERHYKRMRNWGHAVSLYLKDSTTYQLGYAYYELPADTIKRLEEIRKLYGGDPFIIYPEK